MRANKTKTTQTATGISATVALSHRDRYSQVAGKHHDKSRSRPSSSSSSGASSTTSSHAKPNRNPKCTSTSTPFGDAGAKGEGAEDDLWEAEEEDYCDSAGWEGTGVSPTSPCSPQSPAAPSSDQKKDGEPIAQLARHRTHHHHHHHSHSPSGSPTHRHHRDAPAATPRTVPDATFQPPAVATVLSVSRAEVRDAKTKAGMRSDAIIALAESAASSLDTAIHKAAEWMPFAETEPMLTRVPYPTTLSKDLHTSLLKLRSLADLMLEALKTFRVRRSSPSPSSLLFSRI